MASKNAVAEIQALKSENKGLWNALKRFFTSFFNKINKLYKETPPDTPEAKYIADMHKAVKTIRDAFMEGAVDATKKNASNKKTDISNNTDTKTTENKAMRSQARIAEAKYNKATANTEILNLVSNVSNGSFEQQDKVYFGTVTTDVAEEIKSITGIDVTGYRMAVEARQISHILKDHGKTGITDHSMADNNDIAKMEYAMRNPDEISYGGKTRAYSTIRNGKNRTADTVLYEKVIGEKSYYVVQATPDTKAKTLYVVTAFIGKSGYKNKKEAPQLANVKNLGVTSEIGSVVTSNDSISQPAEKVNDKSKIRSKSRSTVTAEQDSAYFEAVKRGDTETAQKMVDEAAKKAGYTYKGMHGTDADFNKFDYSYISDDNKLGLGFYFTNNEKLQFKYDYEKNAYLKFENPIFDNNPILDDILRREADLRESGLSQKETLKKIQSEFGYDGIIAEYNRRALVAFNPEQIKSADAVTYDDNGNVIPLSERFNEKSKDIRHQARNVDKYTEKEYNSFGWVRANEVLATDEYHNFTSEFSKAKTSKEYAEYKSDLDEYMISVGAMHGNKEGVKNKIVFAKGTMANPEITRIIEIDADNETFLSDEREYIYALEKRGIRSKADETIKVYTSVDARSASFGERSGNKNASDNNQLGADRGTGSGTAQKAESRIPENLPQYAVAQKFKDISGVTRNVRRLNGQFMVEGTKRKNYLFDSIEAAINAENESLISRYAKRNERSISWVKSKIAADPEFLYNKIRHKSRSSVTSGQYEQMKANLSHSKVYSKKSAMELVSKIAPGIRNRSFEALSNQLWEGLNSYTTTDERRAFATDMAEIFVDRMVVDTVVKHSEWDSAVERMAYLKPAIGTIQFSDTDTSELKYMLDKNYASLRSRWGYKTPSDGSFKRAYGLDEFISDLSREMPGMEHLAEMHPDEAFICCKSRFAY